MVGKKNFIFTKKIKSKQEKISDEKHARKAAREMKARAIKSKELPPRNALLKIELLTGEIQYSSKAHNAETLFNNPDVKSVTFIGKTESIINRKAREQKAIEARNTAEKAEEMKEKARQMKIDKEIQEALPQNRLGINPSERIGRVELILTEKGKERRMPAFEYDITGQKLIEMYEQGLISGVKGAAKAKFTISKAPVKGKPTRK